ncbi:MAG TPA: two-component regulator propeller domain-containing protein, partial [Pyrinomonadaceae bacterium]|nr:two-component regulator propeller domain-containing protein [Pyrinomonadaceae bacterium]
MCFLARHKHRILFLILAWLAGSMVVSVPTSAERFPIKTYGTPDGLGSSFIESIIQDSHGYLWVCTRDGLSRFDGYKFTTYKTGDGLPIPHVNANLENDDGTFWVATNGGGICKFDPAGKTRSNSRDKDGTLFTTYTLGSDTIQVRADVIFKDKEGRIWVVTNQGLFRLDREAEAEAFKQAPLNLSGNRRPSASGILQDRNGDIWITLSRDGLYRIFKDGRTAHYTEQQHSAFALTTVLLEDHQGRLWVGTRTGLCLVEASPETEKLNVRLYTKKDGLVDNRISSLLETRDGHLWIGTANGLAEYDGASFRSYDSRNGLSGTQITSLLEDRNGNLWIGTQSDGLMKLTRNGFTAYGVTDDKSLTNIYNVFEDDAGNLFVASGDWSLSQITSKEVISARLNMPAETQTAWLSRVILRDRAGEIWAVTDGLGVFRFPKTSDLTRLSQVKPKAIYTRKNGLANDYVRDAFEDSRGDIWFNGGTNTTDLVRWERATETFHRYTESDGVPPSRDLEFYEAKDGCLWFGAANGKIFRYRDGRFTPFAESEAAQRGSITALFIDSQNRLWVSDNTSGAACVVNPTSDRPTIIKYGTAEGLSSDNARCIAEDQWGRIYVGTVRGVDRIDTSAGKIKHFSSADGLSSAFTKFIYRDHQNNLWVGTLNGISKFTPEAPADTAPPEIVISALRIGGEPHD